MSTGTPAATPAAAPPDASTTPQATIVKYIGDKYGPLAAGLMTVGWLFYPTAEKVMNAHVDFVAKTAVTQQEQADNDKEKTDALSRIAGAVEKQTDLIREVKDEHKEMKFDIREIQRTISPKPMVTTGP